MGEGSSNQGDVHEGLNFAAIHKLPFIFVVENNGYAISVPAAKQVSVADVAERASGYGIPGVVVDGADVLACYAAARTAVERARAGEGPTLIEAKVTRLTAHSSDDQQTKYRSEEELAAEKALDPLPKFRAQLVDAGVLTADVEASISADIKATVDDATEYAESQPDPDPATAMRWVFAEDWPGERPPAWGFGPGGPGHGDATADSGPDHASTGGDTSSRGTAEPA
jgi:2-oxoisovalerate dehydrogenase E1 component alpha subunit